MPSKPNIPRVCQQCGKEFLARKHNRGLYCSSACAGEAQRGAGNPYWRGGKHLNPDGYLKVVVDGKSIFEHRHVMEQHLGRKLRDDERVHHINGIRTDNRIENLQLMNPSEHGRLHALRHLGKGDRWARDYDQCRHCESTERPHQALGLCSKCYWQAYKHGVLPRRSEAGD